METPLPRRDGSPVEEGQSTTLLGAATLAILVVGHLVAFGAWYDELGHLAGIFCFPAGIMVALRHGVRGAWWMASAQTAANAVLGTVLGGGGLWELTDPNFLVGHAVLFLVLLSLGRQRDLKRDLDLRVQELTQAQQTLRDVERTQAQSRLNARLSRADRMASVGTLAAGVAHEINNPLTYVIGNLYYALEELDADPADMQHLRGELNELLRDALDGAERVRRIVRDLKTFSRASDGDEEDERIDVHAAVEAAINLVRNEIRHRARLSLELTDVPSLPGNESRLVQVLVNLLMNASQSIQEGNAEAENITVRTRFEPSGHVLVEITDSGCGMPHEVQSRIFDPFFTTKPVGVGTGLGLSVTHGIVKSMKGEIRVRTRAGQGSTFTVALPVDTEDAAASSPRIASERAPIHRTLRLLVVDDEPKVGVSLSRMFRDWEVVVREDGREALALLKQDSAFDCILCDLMMPHVTGMDLYEQVRAQDPHMAQRFVFMTGGAFTPRARTFLSDVDNRCLEKPFDADTARITIASMMRDAGSMHDVGAAQ